MRNIIMHCDSKNNDTEIDQIKVMIKNTFYLSKTMKKKPVALYK